MPLMPYYFVFFDKEQIMIRTSDMTPLLQLFAKVVKGVISKWRSEQGLQRLGDHTDPAYC